MFMIDALIKEIEAELDRLGMTKRDFCDQVNEEPQTYNNWRARGVPSAKRAKIARLMNWDFQAFSEGIIKPVSPQANTTPDVINLDGEENAVSVIVEILIETQNELIDEGILTAPFDPKLLGKMAKQAYINAAKNNQINPQTIKDGIRFAAAMQAT